MVMTASSGARLNGDHKNMAIFIIWGLRRTKSRLLAVIRALTGASSATRSVYELGISGRMMFRCKGVSEVNIRHRK